nr:hypothetical protein [Tanacetum cinerariifolium]
SAVLGGNDFSAQLQHAALVGITLDDLHALTGLPQAPVFFFGMREVFLQRLEAIVVRQHQLPGEVLHQWVLFDAHFSHWPEVVGGHAAEEVQ